MPSEQMRLVLSRKGFDSGVANCASPIFTDGTMLSLPIPLAGSTRFDDIEWRGEPLGPLVQALSGNKVSGNDTAHLDPDLLAASRPRGTGWRPSFGQVGASQSHLHNQKVTEGDLFLFFGWFRRTDRSGRAFEPTAPDEHVLFGWLQIGEVLPVQKVDLEQHPWLAPHPHLDRAMVWNKPNSTIYVATERLMVGGRDLGVPGGGTFGRFHPALRLTQPGSTRRNWLLPGWLNPELTGGMSYNQDLSRWGSVGDRATLDSARQGQEFVSTVDPALVANWMAELLAGCQSGGVEPTVET